MFNRIMGWLGYERRNAIRTDGGAIGFLAAPNTFSGETVNERTALTLPAYHHGLRLYGRVMGSVDLHLEQVLERGRRKATAHPLYRLLHAEPNEYQTAYSFKETATGHMIGWGNHYSYIDRDPSTYRPTALLPLLPDRTYAVRINGQLQYRTTVNGQLITLPPYSVLHLPGFGYDGVMGYSPVRLMRQSLGLTMAATDFGARFFGSGANMGGVLTHPGELSPQAQQDLKDQIQNEYVGNPNAFKVLVTQEGMKFEKFGIPPEDAQFLETRQFQLTEVAQMLGLAPHLIYDLSRSTNNNIEQQSIEAVNYSFRPIAKVWEQECNRKLLYEDEKGAYSFCFDFKSILQGDNVSRSTYQQSRINSGSMTPNEAREIEGQPPLPGGDQLIVNGTMVPLVTALAKAVADLAAAQQASATPADDSADEATETQPVDATAVLDALTAVNDPPTPLNGNEVVDTDGQPGPSVPPELVQDIYPAGSSTGADYGISYGLSRSALRPVAKDAIRRILTKESKAVANKWGKAGFEDWHNGFEQEHRSYMAEALTPLATALKSTGVEVDVARYVEDHAALSRRQLEMVAGKAEGMTEVQGDWTGERIDAATDQLLGDYTCSNSKPAAK